MLAQVFRPDGTAYATFEPTEENADASDRAASLAKLLNEDAKHKEDHMALLALAKRAIDLETGPAWKRSPMKAAETHGAACDALWQELRRQIQEQAGAVPEIEPPSVLQKRLATLLRGQIVTTVHNAIDEALRDIELDGSGETGGNQ